MELQAVIESLKYSKQYLEKDVTLNIYTDSEYVLNLLSRKSSLRQQHFKTKRGNLVRHAEDIDYFYQLEEQMAVTLQKISSHEKKGVSRDTDNNRFVDKLSRKILRNQKRDT